MHLYVLKSESPEQITSHQGQLPWLPNSGIYNILRSEKYFNILYMAVPPFLLHLSEYFHCKLCSNVFSWYKDHDKSFQEANLVL